MKAQFKKKRPYGTWRYYPLNKLANLLVVLKRSAAPAGRKRSVKCLTGKEVKIVEKMGIEVEISEEIKQRD